MENYSGSCHCGAVTFTFTGEEIETAMRCDCSICLRKGILLSAYTVPPENMQIKAAKGASQIYQFGTMKAKHHFCTTCGIHTFVETYLNPGHFRVNLGCIEGLDALDLPAKVFEGRKL